MGHTKKVIQATARMNECCATNSDVTVKHIYQAVQAISQLLVAQSERTKKNHLLSVEEAADYIGLARITLTRYRLNDRGPTYLRVGHKIRYRKKDLDIWLDSRAVTTSDSKGDNLLNTIFKINRIIYAQGAPMGTAPYWEIRELCAEILRARHKEELEANHADIRIHNDIGNLPDPDEDRDEKSNEVRSQR